jgi:hypothetical protein
MYYAHALINIATCHGMSKLGFSSLSGTIKNGMRVYPENTEISEKRLKQNEKE